MSCRGQKGNKRAADKRQLHLSPIIINFSFVSVENKQTTNRKCCGGAEFILEGNWARSRRRGQQLSAFYLQLPTLCCDMEQWRLLAPIGRRTKIKADDFRDVWGLQMFSDEGSAQTEVSSGTRDDWRSSSWKRKCGTRNRSVPLSFQRCDTYSECLFCL